MVAVFQSNLKRMFAYSSIEHMGIIVFAFGMGGPLANFAGLLHMVMHSLTKSAIFFAVGHVAQIKGTQKIEAIRGLTESRPVLGWGLALGVLAGAGAGALVALVFALFAVGLGTDQIITGTAVTLGGLGMTGAIYQARFGATGTALSLPTLAPLPVPGLSALPAARAGRLVSLDALRMLGFSPRLPQAVSELARRMRAP